MNILVRRIRVPWRLAASVLAFAIATLVLGGLVLHQAERWSQGAAMEALRVTVRLGAHSMEQWLAERFADADVLATSTMVLHAERRGQAAAVQPPAPGIQQSLDTMRRRYDYRSVSVLDAAGREATHVSGTRPSMQDVEAALAVDGGQGARWVDLPASASSSGYRAAVVRRMAADGPQSELVLYLEVEPLQLVRTLAVSRSADLHGHSILLRRQGDTVERFEPARSAGGQQLMRSPDVRPENIEYTLLTTSLTEGRGRDAEGRQVLAARADLSLPGWAIVGMLDDSALLAALRQQTRLAVLAYGVLLALLVVGLAGWVRTERHRQTQREANVVEFYDKILRHGDALYTLTDWRGRLVDASHSAFASFGYSKQEMLGLDVMDLVPEHARQDVRAMVHDMQIGETRPFLGERMRADGSIFLVQGSVGLLEIKGRRYFHSVGKDVSHERQVQARLLQAASVFDLAPAAIVVADRNLVVVSVNPAFMHITGYAAHEVIGQHVRTLTTGAHPQRTSEVLSSLLRDDLWEGELPGRRKNGEIYPRRLLAAAHRNADGKVDQYIGIFTDLSTLKQAEIKAEYHANHDQLTKLPNRRRLEQVLPAMVQAAQGRGASLTVAIFNLDRFKSVNDSFGLAEGDKLLVEVARRLQAVVPPERLYHFGADEFVAVLDGAPVVQALTIDRALARVCVKGAVGTHAFAPSVSVGVASYPELARDAEALLTSASAALRTAKERGGRSWQLYEPGMNATAHDDMLLAVDLRAAIDEGQFELHFQPQARLSDRAFVGMEALLRWNHPARGSVPPSRFIPVAEASGLIDDLSRWVLEEACRIWSGWRSAGLAPPAVAVNVSALQFKHPHFLTDVSRTMARHDITPHCLVLELTESLIMDNSELAIATMHRLTAMGVRIALDDFGTGYSSLSYLTRFPLDKLKIDRSFILPIGTPTGEEGEAIVQSVISMAKALKLRVVAEGVETEEQAQFLSRNGCDELQGYLYARPMPAAALQELLAATREHSDARNTGFRAP